MLFFGEEQYAYDEIQSNIPLLISGNTSFLQNIMTFIVDLTGLDVLHQPLEKDRVETALLRMQCSKKF